MAFILYPLAFILTISILVTVHEYGHFWVARRVGIKVLRFSVGFGKPIWKYQGKDGVEYVLASIPLGGYVKMLGEGDNTVDAAEAHLAFSHKPIWARALVVVAGPLSNALLAILLLWFVFTWGEYNMRPVVGEVVADTPAAQAGFSKGDEILQVGGEPVVSWEQTLYALLQGVVDDRDLVVQVKTEQGAQVPLRLSGQALGALLKEPGDVIDKLGLKRLSWPSVVGKTVAGGPAEKAGLKSGDRILEADGQPATAWGDWIALIHKKPDAPMRLHLLRDGQPLDLEVQLGSKTEDGKLIGQVGVEVDVAFFKEQRVWVSYDPLTAFGRAWNETADMSLLTLKVMKKLLNRQASVHNMSGPLMIAQIAGKTISFGLTPFLKFLALISINLAVLNLLPIPILDGGHLVYLAGEAIKGEPLSETALARAQYVGLGLLLSLMVLVFYVDIVRFIN